MSLKTYQKIRRLVLAILMIWVGVSVFKGQAFLSLVGLGLGMGFLSLMRLKVKRVVEDERQISVGGRAARVSFQILMPILGLTSLALVSAGGGEFYYVKALGIILSYVTCLGLIIYLLSYWYFDRQCRG